MNEPLQKREYRLLILATFAYFLLRGWGLKEYGVNGLFDEGVYLSLMQTESEGHRLLYRDIIFGHPPAVIWAGAWLWGRVGGSLFAIRLAYISFNALGYVPMYALARRYSGVAVAQGTLWLMVLSPGFATWLGRSIFMELPQNVLVFTALWLLFCFQKNSGLRATLAGTLFAFSFLIKESAIPLMAIMGFALFVAGLMPRRYSEEEPNRQITRLTWLWFGVGAVVTTALTLWWLSHIPNCLQYFAGYYSLSKNKNDTYQWGQHLYELTNGIWAFTLVLPFGFLGLVRMLWRPRHRVEFALALFALLYAFVIFYIPNRFYWRYWVSVIPIWCWAVAVWWHDFRQSEPSVLKKRLAGSFAILFGLVHLIVLVGYHLSDLRVPSAYGEAVQILRRSPAPLFALDPIWNAVSGVPLPDWKHEGGDVHGREVAMKANPKEVEAVIGQCPTVLLNREALHWLLPETEAYIRAHYRTVFLTGRRGEKHYVEILERDRE